MTQQGENQLHDEIVKLSQEKPYLNDYVNQLYDEHGEYPMYVEDVDDEHAVDSPNVMYRTGEDCFAHIFGPIGEEIKYYVVEPSLDSEDEQLAKRIKKRMLELSASLRPPEEESEFEDYFETLFDESLMRTGSSDSFIGELSKMLKSPPSVNDDQYKRIKHILNRDIAGLGPLQGLMLDPHNEDIHIIGHEETYVDHDVFSMLSTSVEWSSRDHLTSWIENIGERMDNPVSDATPIIDSTLPDGSRINIMYSEDVSIRGPSLTIRQGVEVPLTILQITKWGTISPELAAYLWLCLENDRTCFVVGETASGKTTTLNAMLSFIPRDSKLYTAEDTAEVVPPHDAWQQLITREGTGDERTDVDMFDLVASALRSRPNYIVVGEVRGPEAQMAFQAAQTGHPVLLTFHASDIVSMIQRLTGEPINVPEPFIDNCDVALFQNRVKQGDEVARRVTSVQEIEGYSKEEEGVITREVFSWNPRTDDIEFTGLNNSYVLEDQIGELLGMEDTTDIYDEVERRADIIRRLIDADIIEYHDVNEAIDTIQRDGVEALSEIDSTGLTSDMDFGGVSGDK